MQLGSVLAPESEGPKGPDLVVEVEVPQEAVGLPDGYLANVPEFVAQAGDRVRRQLSPFEKGEGVRLQIPPGFPENGALKLRGQGGLHKDGPAGDLIVKVRLVDKPLPVPVRAGGGASPLRAGLALAVIAAAATALWLALM